MIAIAIFIVWQLGRDNCPMAYRHVWMSDDWNTALVELVDAQKEIEHEEHWSMELSTWWLEERTDIGY